MYYIDKEVTTHYMLPYFGPYFFAERLIKHLNSGKDRQFLKLLQLKISANSLKNFFTLFPV